MLLGLHSVGAYQLFDVMLLRKVLILDMAKDQAEPRSTPSMEPEILGPCTVEPDEGSDRTISWKDHPPDELHQLETNSSVMGAAQYGPHSPKSCLSSDGHVLALGAGQLGLYSKKSCSPHVWVPPFDEVDDIRASIANAPPPTAHNSNKLLHLKSVDCLDDESANSSFTAVAPKSSHPFVNAPCTEDIFMTTAKQTGTASSTLQDGLASILSKKPKAKSNSARIGPVQIHKASVIRSKGSK